MPHEAAAGSVDEADAADQFTDHPSVVRLISFLSVSCSPQMEQNVLIGSGRVAAELSVT